MGEAINQHKLGKRHLMGIRDRVWKKKDPLYHPVKRLLRQLEEKSREDPLAAVAEEVERQVSAEAYVDLYWLFIYTAL